MDSDPNNWYPEPVPMWNLQTPTIFVPPSPTLVNPPLSPPPHFLSHSIPPFQSPAFIPNPAAVQSCIDAFAVFQQGMNEASNDFRENMQKIQESLQQSRRLIRELRTKVPTASSSGPQYAPEDPTLPSPWRGLIDGSTGSVYFWNTATNQTQYEKPCPLTHPTQPIYLHRKQLRVLRRRVSMAATRRLVKDTRKPDLLSRVGKYSGSKLNRKHGLWAVKAQNGEVFSDIMEAIRQHCVGTETSPTNPSFSPLISDVTEQHAVLFSVAVADEVSLASPKPTNDDAVVPNVTSTGAALAYAHELDPALVCRNLLPSVTEYDPSPLSLASDRAEDSVDLCYASFTSRTDVVVDVSNAATAIESKLTDIVELHETEAVDKQGFISGEEDLCSDSFIVQQVTDEFYKQEFGMVIRFYNLGNSDISTRFDSTHIYNGFINVGIGDNFSTGDGLCKPGLLFGDCELFHDEDPMLKVHGDGAIVTHTRFPQLLLAADNFNSEIIEFAVLTDDYCYGKLRVPQSAWFENIQWSHAQVGDTYSMCLRSVETLVSGARAPLQCPPSSVVKIDGRLLLALLDSIGIAEKSETRSSGSPALNSVNCLRTDQLMWPISSVAGFAACPYVPLYVTLPPGILNSYCNLVEVLASSFANCHCLRPACTLLLKNWAQYNYPYNAISYHPSWEAVENDNTFNEVGSNLFHNFDCGLTNLAYWLMSLPLVAWFENSMMNTNMLEDHEQSAIVHQFFLFLLHTKKLFSHRGMPSALETKWVVGTLVAVFRNVKLSVHFFIERKEPYTRCFRDFFLSPLFSALYGTLNLLAFESFAPSMVTAVLAATLYHTFLSMCPYLADIAYPDHDIAICEQTTSSTTWKPVSGTCSSLFTVYSYGGKLSKTETASMTYEAVGVPANLVLSSQRLMKLVFLAGVLQLVIGLPSSPCSECQRATALLLGQSVWSVSFFTISFPSFLLDAENFSLKPMTTGTTPKAQLLKQQFSLGVSEANLESHMLEATKMEFVLGLLSGVPLLFDRFIKTLKPEDLVKATVGGEFLTTSGTTHIPVLVETALPLKLGRHLSPRIIEFEVLAAPYRIFGVESNNRAPHYVAFIQKLLSARRRVISNVECGKLLMDLSHVLICYLTYFQVGDYCEMGITLAGKDQLLYTWGKLTRDLSYLKFGRCYMSEVMFASTAQYLVTVQQDDIYSSTWLNKDQVAWSQFVHEFAKGYYKVPSLTNSLDMVFHNKLMYLFEFVAYAPSDRLIGAKSEVVGYHSQQSISSLGFITSISNPIHIILQCSQVVMPKLITVLSKAILLTDYDVIEVPASNLYLVEVVLRFSCHTDLLNQPGRLYVHGFEEFLQLNSKFSCLSVPVHVVGQTKGENADTSNWQMVEYVSDKQQSEECGLKLRFYSALIAAFWNSTLIAAFWWLGLNQSDKLCIFPATHALSTPKKLLPKGCSYTKILDHTCSFSVHCKA